MFFVLCLFQVLFDSVFCLSGACAMCTVVTNNLYACRVVLFFQSCLDPIQRRKRYWLHSWVGRKFLECGAMLTCL